MRNVHLQCITKMNLVSKFKVISVLIDSCTYNLVYNSVGSTGVQEQRGRSVAVRSYEVANNYASGEVDNDTMDDNNAGACDHEIVEIEGNHTDSEIEDGKYDCGERDDCARNCEFDGGNAGITNASIVDGDGACDDYGSGGGDDNGGGGGDGGDDDVGSGGGDDDDGGNDCGGGGNDDDDGDDDGNGGEGDDSDDVVTEAEAESNSEGIPQPLSTAIKKLSLLPLFAAAPISMKASWLACNYFAVRNNLSEAATKQLLDLIAIHCPETDQCARSTFQLRKRLNPFDDVEMHMYCSECMKELLDTKKCTDSNCRRKRSNVCYLSLLPFHQHLCTMFSSRLYPFFKKFLILVMYR